ncbi:hypothetical protein H6G26_41465 [Nostoc sp. FACHB-888]|nr:hypothetical protein [Nostoc sp. FACHB-888]
MVVNLVRSRLDIVLKAKLSPSPPQSILTSMWRKPYISRAIGGMSGVLVGNLARRFGLGAFVL